MTSAGRRGFVRPLVGAAAVLGLVAAGTSLLPDEAAAPDRAVARAAAPAQTALPALPTPEASTVADDDAAVSACVRAVRERTGERVDRSAALELVTTPSGWRATVVVASGRSLDCHLTRAGRTSLVATPAVAGDVRTQLGLQHLACRAVEPGLVARSTGAPDADEALQAALAAAVPHLAPDTVRAVVDPHRSEGPAAQVEAVYAFCLDRGWGGNRALLGG